MTGGDGGSAFMPVMRSADFRARLTTTRGGGRTDTVFHRWFLKKKEAIGTAAPKLVLLLAQE